MNSVGFLQGVCRKKQWWMDRFLLKKQGLQIPNMLWRLECNSLEFQFPYGDKVLASPPVRGLSSMSKVSALAPMPNQSLSN